MSLVWTVFGVLSACLWVNSLTADSKFTSKEGWIFLAVALGSFTLASVLDALHNIADALKERK